MASEMNMLQVCSSAVSENPLLGKTWVGLLLHVIQSSFPTSDSYYKLSWTLFVLELKLSRAKLANF